MKFNEFWVLITRLVRLDLETPTRRKRFNVFYDLEHDLVRINILERSGTRDIRRSEFQKIWDLARKSVNPFDASQYRKATNVFSISYIVPIMKNILNGEQIE